MMFIDNEMVVFCDVDDTLIMHDNSLPYDLYITDPYMPDFTQAVRKHQKHIDFLKNLKGRGYTIIVWSAGGAKWANTVVKALQLENYVDICMCKPVKYVDDLEAHQILGTRVYLNEKGKTEDEKND